MRKSNVAKVAVIVVVLSFIGLVGFYGWKLDRYVHYKWSYESMIQVQVDKSVAPLNAKIAELEARIRKLEKP